MFPLFRKKQKEKTSDLEDIINSSDAYNSNDIEKLNFVVQNQYRLDEELSGFDALIYQLNLQRNNKRDIEYKADGSIIVGKELVLSSDIIKRLTLLYQDYNSAFVSTRKIPDKKLSFLFYSGIRDYLSKKKGKVKQIYNNLYTFLSESATSLKEELTNLQPDFQPNLQGEQKSIDSGLAKEREKLANVLKLLLSFDTKILSPPLNADERREYTLFSNIDERLQKINSHFSDLKKSYEGIAGRIIDDDQLMRLNKMKTESSKLYSSALECFYFEKQDSIKKFNDEISFVVQNSKGINALINDIDNRKKIFDETNLRHVEKIDTIEDLEFVNSHIRKVTSTLNLDLTYPAITYVTSKVNDFSSLKKLSEMRLAEIINQTDKSLKEFVSTLLKFDYSHSLDDDLNLLSDKIEKVVNLKTKLSDYLILREQFASMQQKHSQVDKEEGIKPEKVFIPKESELMSILKEGYNNLDSYKEKLTILLKERDKIKRALFQFNEEYNQLLNKVNSTLERYVKKEESSNQEVNSRQLIETFSSLNNEILMYIKDVEISSENYESLKSDDLTARYLDKDLSSFLSSSSILKNYAEELHSEVEGTLDRLINTNELNKYEARTDELKRIISDINLHQKEFRESASKSFNELSRHITKKLSDRISEALEVKKLINSDKDFDAHLYLMSMPVPKTARLFNVYSLLGKINRFNANKIVDSLPALLSGLKLWTDIDLMNAEQLSYVLKNAGRDENFVLVRPEKLKSTYSILDREIQTYKEQLS